MSNAHPARPDSSRRWQRGRLRAGVAFVAVLATLVLVQVVILHGSHARGDSVSGNRHDGVSGEYGSAIDDGSAAADKNRREDTGKSSGGGVGGIDVSASDKDGHAAVSDDWTVSGGNNVSAIDGDAKAAGSEDSSAVGRGSSNDVSTISGDGKAPVSDNSSAVGRRGSGNDVSAIDGSEDSSLEQCRPLAQLGEAARGAAVNDTVILTVFNEAMLGFGRNWLTHAAAAGMTNVVVGCADAATAALASDFAVPCVDVGPYVRDENDTAALYPHEPGFAWGATAWKRASWARTVVLPAAMRAGLHVAWSDIDVVWFRDPTPLLEQHPEVDLIMGSDHLGTSLPEGDAGFEPPQFAFWHEYNAGTILLRRSPRTLQLLDDWAAEQYTGKQKFDQDALNQEVLRPGIDEDNVSPQLAPDDERVLQVANRTVRLGVMPVSRFMTGRTFCVQRLHEIKGLRPYSLHMTWTGGERAGKVARLREAGLWRGDALGSEYLSDDRFLAIDLAWPRVPFNESGAPFSEWSEAWAMEAYHLAAIDFQFSQLYYGIQLALALNRTLILPKMACFCDHNWWPSVACRSVPQGDDGSRSSDFPLPYACAFDFLFMPEQFDDAPDEFGPPLRFRHHNFLSEPGLPEAVLERQAVVRTSPELRCSARACTNVVATRCERQGHSSQVQPDTYCIPPGLNSRQLGRVLAPLNHTRVLHFADPTAAWGGFLHSWDQQAADQRAQHLTHMWAGRDTEVDQVPPGRGSTEPYFICPFADPAFLPAIVNGSMPLTELLMHRPQRKWAVDAAEYQFRGADSVTRV